MIVSSGNGEIFDFALPLGVGLVQSSMNLTRLMLFDRPEFLIFIGSAGSYGEGEIFDIFETATASNIEHCFLKKKCYTPIDNIVTFSDNISREKIVNSSNYITTSKKISKKYRKLNLFAENMEFFSILKIAKEFSVPVKGIFIITNYCNEDAPKDYQNNIVKAKELLSQYIREKYIR